MLTATGERVCQALDNSGEAQAVSFDISKVFDRVLHVVFFAIRKDFVFLAVFLFDIMRV